MTHSNIVHFLLVFDHQKGRLISQARYDDTAAAIAAYDAAEKAHQDEQLIEIVLVGSDSIDTVQITHANYFDGSVALSGYFTGV